MIYRTNGSKWGIKDSGLDFTPDIHSIIDNSNKYIIVCGYNFSPLTHRTSIIPRLIARKNAGVDVLFISPPRMWGYGNTKHTTNINHLVNNNIGVILNSNNHSKWLLSDFGYYYGSLNFTAASMLTKVEVISFCDKLHQPRHAIPLWMQETKTELLNFAIHELRAFNSVAATVNLGTINGKTLLKLRRVLKRILKFNPSIEKIETTLLNYEDVRIELSTIIDDYFTCVNFESLNQIWRRINNSISTLDRLAFEGNEIFLNNLAQPLIEPNSDEYNTLHEQFVTRIEALRDYINDNNIKENRLEKLIQITKEIEKKLNGFRNLDREME
jgi:hypothetical protein